MRALCLLYDGYIEWEISPLTYMLQVTDVDVDTTGVQKEVKNCGGFRVQTDYLLHECDADAYDLLLIPGGEPDSLYSEASLTTLIQHFHDQRKTIAAICGGTLLLGASAIMENHTYSTSVEPEDLVGILEPAHRSLADVTVSDGIITAEGNAYIEFAVAVMKHLNLFKDREDELETVLFFKNQLRG
ncbi:hypothetical protein N781_04595 [Pontibacillus halophilus JSM 076056 = DSM 19796]|uniref:DJ-1/PfpI domain-containing protein n=1 Tax=Pontibacillus halophilus JSM 076056 = DSM 19796 TaxID=1385510 RepID=A0A0A5I6F2_9BACI|nr:DJ-1/PfpI family protein [Pontibacillus halophilus]KGX91407.1 hypothetical protein N781_04595 [Pontibacillus halophilus JSM 076056 = DSM 19796]